MHTTVRERSVMLNQHVFLKFKGIFLLTNFQEKDQYVVTRIHISITIQFSVCIITWKLINNMKYFKAYQIIVKSEWEIIPYKVDTYLLTKAAYILISNCQFPPIQ